MARAGSAGRPAARAQFLNRDLETEEIPLETVTNSSLIIFLTLNHNQDGICDKNSAPSVSSISRVLRGSGGSGKSCGYRSGSESETGDGYQRKDHSIDGILGGKSQFTSFANCARLNGLEREPQWRIERCRAELGCRARSVGLRGPDANQIAFSIVEQSSESRSQSERYRTSRRARDSIRGARVGAPRWTPAAANSGARRGDPRRARVNGA